METQRKWEVCRCEQCTAFFFPPLLAIDNIIYYLNIIPYMFSDGGRMHVHMVYSDLNCTSACKWITFSINVTIPTQLLCMAVFIFELFNIYFYEWGCSHIWLQQTDLAFGFV